MMKAKYDNRHWKTKEKARSMRRKGASYNAICEEVNVAKSTISLWCHDIRLTKAQHEKLKSRKESLQGIRVIQQNFWNKRKAAFARGIKLFQENKNNSFFVAGLMMYWAEGSKKGTAEVTNSDPKVVVLMVKWFSDFFQIDPQINLRIHLHLHSGQSESKVKAYWSQLTQVPVAHFKKSFIKPEGSGHRKKRLYNGTVALRVKGIGSAYMLFSIFGALAGFMQKHFGQPIESEEWIEKLPYAD